MIVDTHGNTDALGLDERIAEQNEFEGYSLSDVQGWNLEPPLMFNDWLPAGFSVLGGRPKAGKSYLAERTSFEIAKNEIVLHFCLEYGPTMVQERFRDYPVVSPHHLNLYYEGMLPRLDNGGLEKLLREIERKNASLCVIDTLAMIKRPGDQKGYEAEYIAMGELKRLCTQSGASVLALHHTRKPSQQDTGTIFDRFLGSTALAAVPDNLLIFDDLGGNLKLHGKGRLLEEFEVPIRWADPGFMIEEPDAMLRDKAPLQYQIKTHLRQVGPCANSELADALRKPLNSVTNATRKLCRDGTLQKLPDGRLRVLV